MSEVKAEDQLVAKRPLKFHHDLQQEEQDWVSGEFKSFGKVVTIAECKEFMSKLNAGATHKAEVKKSFIRCSVTKDGELNLEEFQNFWGDVRSLPLQARPLWDIVSAKSGFCTAEQLQSFFATQQLEKLTLEDAKLLICQAQGFDLKQENPLLSQEGFNRLITCPVLNGVFDQRNREVYQDMTRPLSEYWISSSHNSYLSGDQLFAKSSCEALSHALLQGVRIVELDCWDDGKEEPKVLHGHTFTAPIKFRDAVRTIAQDGFKTSEYPVIITIENHCSGANMKVQAQIIREECGERLYIPSQEPVPFYPSPEDLKGKIVIRDKPKGRHIALINESKEAKDEVEGLDDEEDDVGESEVAYGRMTEEEKAAFEKKQKREEEHMAAMKKEHKSSAMPDELFELVTVRNAKKKPFDRSTFHNVPVSASFDENKLKKLTKKKGLDLIEYTQRHLARIYPKGTRTDSSNYDPSLAWSYGCQVVALNYQSNNKSVCLNQGRFRDNGGCGYVLKPDHLRLGPGKDHQDPRERRGEKKELTLKILSGHFLPKPSGVSNKGGDIVDPYVNISIDGQLKSVSHKTKALDNNGFDPLFEETFLLDIESPETALLYLEVMDSDFPSDRHIASVCVPVNCMREGYRALPLYDILGKIIPRAFMFIQVHFGTIPEMKAEVAANVGNYYERRVQSEFKTLDKKLDDHVSFKEIRTMCSRMNLQVPSGMLKAKFQEFDDDNSGSLDFKEFTNLLEDVDSLPNTLAIWRANVDRKIDLLMPAEFAKFLTNVQKQETTAEEAKKIICDIMQTDNGIMPRLAFTRYLAAKENSVLMAADPCFDIKQPLRNFHISTSNQVDQMHTFEKALANEKKAFTMHVHQNLHVFKKNVPISKLLSLLVAHIDEHKDCTPFILDLSFSYKPGFLAKLKTELNKTLGDKLYTKENGQDAPLGDLLGKVLIRCPEEGPSGRKPWSGTAKLPAKVCDHISLSYDSKDGKKEYFSSEVASNEAAIKATTEKHMVKISGAKQHPAQGWQSGAQMVQTSSHKSNWSHPHSSWNWGQFHFTQGYAVRAAEKDFAAPKQVLKIKIISAHYLPKPQGSKVTDILDPYIRLELLDYGHEEKDSKTKTVLNNGFDPVFGHVREFKIHAPSVALVRLRAIQHNYLSDVIAAETVLPVRMLREGFRRVNLFNDVGQESDSAYLFVHVQRTPA